MRTTTDVIEAARMGEQCTEEELRLAIVSMRATAIMAHRSHARWATDNELPHSVRSLAKIYWDSINTGWNIPLDQRVSPEDRPGNPDLYKRRDIANAVMDQAAKRGDS